jgi:hypothetical protein
MPIRVPSILPLSNGRLLNHVLIPCPRGRVENVSMFFRVSPDGNTPEWYRESRSFPCLTKEGPQCEPRWKRLC